MKITDEIFGPTQPNIVQVVQGQIERANADRVWDEIEEFLPEAYRGPQWPRYGVWFEMEAE